MKTRIFTLFLLVSTFAIASEEGGGHNDPFSREFLAMFFILIAAVTGRFIARKLKQSEVLGELIIGIAVGALLFSMNNRLVTTIRYQNEMREIIQETSTQEAEFDVAVKNYVMNETDLDADVQDRIIQAMTADNFLNSFLNANYTLLFSSLGVLLLLFMVGLEVSTSEMLKMGSISFSVATLGVVFPFVLGYLVAEYMIPSVESQNVAIFIGATLAATSIGITARVFKDTNSLNLKESKLVLGAAVIDDIMGLILLAVVSGLVTSGHIDFTEVIVIVAKAIGFLVFVFLAERYILKHLVRYFAIFAGKNTFLLFPFSLLLFFSWLASAIGLAPIVGAFCAGLVLRNEFFKKYNREDMTLEHIIGPLEGIFAPVFFVLMGFQVDVMAFGDIDVLWAGLLLTVVAIIGKLLAGIFLSKEYDKLMVGIGLVPRGEVGLIFASIGKAVGVLNDELFAVVIIVVILTTLVTPPLLSMRLKKIMKTSAD
ncbi:MAG: cation:proton antiporter [Flavobacteriia bacterium]|nr:cation:proton antiporter [Flavobacteriia bacterium]